MNRTIKQASIGTYYYRSHQELGKHLNDLLLGYNLAGRLKALSGETPLQFIEQEWQKDLQLFHSNIATFTKELNIYSFFAFFLKFFNSFVLNPKEKS